MAILFVDGFPYETGQITSVYTGRSDLWTIETSSGRYGGRYIYVNSGGWTSDVYFSKLISTTTTIIVQCGFKYPLHNNSLDSAALPILGFVDTATLQCSVCVEAGIWKLYRSGNSTGTLLASSAQAYAYDTAWHQLEVKIKVHNSTGTCVVKIDGQTAISEVAGNLDLTMTANDSANYVYFAGGSATYVPLNTFKYWFSDIVIMDTTGSYCNDLLGIRKVKLYVPTADATYSDWTPSDSGNNYEMVDEIPPNGDTDYNASSTVGNIDSFDHADMDSGITPDAIVCTAYAKTTDAGVGKLKGFVRSAGDEGEGTEVTLASSYSFLQSVIYVDPDTSAPFTRAAFNAAELGYKRSA